MIHPKQTKGSRKNNRERRPYKKRMPLMCTDDSSKANKVGKQLRKKTLQEADAANVK
jgi:hypothetical protein